MLSVCCISSKISYSCTVQGRGIPLRSLSWPPGLTHVLNFWPKYWFITWVNPSGEYSLLGSDSLFGSEQFQFIQQEKVSGFQSSPQNNRGDEKLTKTIWKQRNQLFQTDMFFCIASFWKKPVNGDKRFSAVQCVYLRSPISHALMCVVSWQNWQTLLCKYNCLFLNQKLWTKR